jgi:hypothetical protein
MIRPHREALGDQIEADETYVGGSEPGKRGRGAGGKTVVAGAVERGRGARRGGRLGRLRLAALPDASRRGGRRTARSISHRFARLVEHAVQTPPTTYPALVAAAPA